MFDSLVIYGSSTGNTEYAARIIASELVHHGVNVVVKDVLNAKMSDVAMKDGIVIFGCSTWGDALDELQDDFDLFFTRLRLQKPPLKRAALFGCGDSRFHNFCGAVDTMSSILAEQNVLFPVNHLKIDGDPRKSLKKIADWTAQLAAIKSW